MKSIITYTIILALFMVSCTKGFEELNTPPTTSSTIDPGALLAKSLRDSKFTQGHEYQSLTCGAWIQWWVSSNNLPSSRYFFQRHRGENWDGLYSNIMNLAQIRHHLLKGQEESPEGRTRLAIARVAEVDLWQTITDLYGDIPYSESAQGENNLNTQPKYDTQEDIYKSLISTLDEAIGVLNASTATDKSYGKSDLYYGGDVSKWIKYANSVKLQLGMRMKYVAPDLARTVVSQALSSPLIASNNDNAKIETSTQYNSSRHPILNLFRTGSPDNKYLGKAFIDYLVKTNDPRLRMIASPSLNSVNAGTPVYRGKLAAPTDEELLGVVNNDYSLASDLTYFNDTYNSTTPIPCYIYTYSEICFYKAEAALEGWGGLNVNQAESFYQEGIRAAMALKPYNITEIPQDYIDAEFSLEGLTSEQKLEKIMNQKWILMFGRSYDIYAEWRRTGYPALKPGNNLGDTNGTIPRRRGYPQDEVDLNPDNHKAASSRMSNGDSYTSRVWWDAKK
jgi:hypothetical protein